MNQPDQKQQIQIKAGEEKLRGDYANMMQILHTREEFVLDFLNIFPPSGILNSRVIVSPGHFKRMIKAMEENLKKYEDQFGKISESETPTNEIGFKA
ncbi:MAG: DUF3467 domain-containing protein [Candidatus Moraniibacteriota bacterium]